MILIADGGSTKVDWCLAEHGTLLKRMTTTGANPYFRTREDIREELRQTLLPELTGTNIEAVHFFGAGCAFPEKAEIVRTAIADLIPADIKVGSDLLGAAIGLFGHEPGIACILGTGANSCFYDGEKIVKNVPGLGFILGDEGSGAVLGKQLVSACLSGRFPVHIKERLLEHLQLTPSGILDRVYKHPLPNRFLAGLAPFIKEHMHEPAMYELVFNAFTDFFHKNVMQYEYHTHACSFIGSVAYHFSDTLQQAAASLGIRIEHICPSPMEGLVMHLTK